ncbi:MAG: DUF1328 domain-containing protein [Verrucomicrobia bacterium]|nr:DUF1328 domain-containing protein [Verrucomicrobiota bacterium]
MLKWAVIFLALAIITGYMAFKGNEANAKQISKWLFFLFALLFLIFLILALIQGNRCAI